MCNLYRVRTATADVALMFGVEPRHVSTFNAATEIYPGYPGMIVRDAGGERRLEAMTWGFPVRLKTMKPTSKPKAVNNARDDKLTTSFWRPSFETRRCLIPLTQWAEPEGEARRMTRTWYSLPDIEMFAVAGIWRPTEEWGNAYSMVMVDACPDMSDVHDRMPVILPPGVQDQWLVGSTGAAFDLVRPWIGPLASLRSDEPWFQRPITDQEGLLL